MEIKMFNMFHILSCTLFVASLRFCVEERNVICYKIYVKIEAGQVYENHEEYI